MGRPRLDRAKRARARPADEVAARASLEASAGHAVGHDKHRIGNAQLIRQILTLLLELTQRLLFGVVHRSLRLSRRRSFARWWFSLPRQLLWCSLKRLIVIGRLEAVDGLLLTGTGGRRVQPRLEPRFDCRRVDVDAVVRLARWRVGAAVVTAWWAGHTGWLELTAVEAAVAAWTAGGTSRISGRTG